MLLMLHTDSISESQYGVNFRVDGKLLVMMSERATALVFPLSLHQNREQSENSHQAYLYFLELSLVEAFFN